jgi:pilus assembly protein CpaB
MSKQRRTFGVVAAVVLAVLGTLGLVAYVNGAEDRALAGERTVDVYVVSQAIPAGTDATKVEDRVTRERVPVKVQAKGAVTKLSQLDGTVAAIDLVKGEQLVSQRFVNPGQAVVAHGKATVPVGYFESTISLEPDQALGGQVRAGQKVSVVAVGTRTARDATAATVIARGVLVTGVQIDGEEGDSVEKRSVTAAPTGKFFVTLAMSQTDLESLVTAVNDGKVWLATEAGPK